jgi:hypothetical protein
MPRHPPYTLKSLATFTASPSTSGPPLHPTRKTRRTGRDKSGPARAWRGRTMLPAIRMSRSRPSRGTSQDTRTTGRPVMGQLSPKKVLDDARPTESTNLERQTVGTAAGSPGWGSPRMQGRASRIRPSDTDPRSPRHRWAVRSGTCLSAFFLEPRLQLSKSNVRLRLTPVDERSRRMRVSQPCFVGGLIRIRLRIGLLLSCAVEFASPAAASDP